MATMTTKIQLIMTDLDWLDLAGYAHVIQDGPPATLLRFFDDANNFVQYSYPAGIVTDVEKVVGGVTVVYVPSVSIKDLAGNPAAGSFTKFQKMF